MSRVLAKRKLVVHPASADDGLAVAVTLSRLGRDALKLEYVVVGAVDALVVPAETLAERRENLWQTTCFEAFLGSEREPSYLEFNFSPSRQWANYRFSGYRTEMQPETGFKIDIVREALTDERLAITATIAPRNGERPLFLARGTNIGLSAVIERKEGGKSYWALEHRSGTPDFHDPACFTLKLD